MNQNVNNFGKMFRTQYVVTHLLKKQDKKNTLSSQFLMLKGIYSSNYAYVVFSHIKHYK